MFTKWTLELEKARGAAKGAFGTSSLSTSNVPTELTTLVAAHQNSSKLILPTKTAVSSANQDYDKLTDSSVPVPSAPVYAARLNGLLKTLATAEGAVAQSVKARKELITELEKLLHTHREALSSEESQLTQLSIRKTETDDKKREVEHAIMRGLGPSETSGSPIEGASRSPPPEPARPEVEALTPPPMVDEPSISPISNPTIDSPRDNPDASFEPPAASGIEMLSSLASQYQSLPIGTNGSNKRRRVDDRDDFPDMGGDDGIDADVAEMLRKDSRGQADSD
jgi:regulator of Ty1 transposition protein 103